MKVKDEQVPNYGNIPPVEIRHGHHEAIQVGEEEEEDGEVDDINDNTPDRDEEESMEVIPHIFAYIWSVLEYWSISVRMWSVL